MDQQNHIQQYRKTMQHQKHQQAKHYKKCAKDIPSLETGNAVHIQLVPNMRRWVTGTIIEVASASEDSQSRSLHQKQKVN